MRCKEAGRQVGKSDKSALNYCGDETYRSAVVVALDRFKSMRRIPIEEIMRRKLYDFATGRIVHRGRVSRVQRARRSILKREGNSEVSFILFVCVFFFCRSRLSRSRCVSSRSETRFHLNNLNENHADDDKTLVVRFCFPPFIRIMLRVRISYT